MNIADRLVQLRKERNYSTTKLAKLAGIAQSTLREIEIGNTSPTWDTILKLCKALDVSPIDLISQDIFAGHAQGIPPEVRQIIDKVQKLPPDKLRVLNAVLDSWIEND